MKKLVVSMLLVLMLVTGCGKVPKLENGQEAVISLDNGAISVDDLYEEMKDRYALNVLIDMMDRKILNDKYESTDEEKTYIENALTQAQTYYNYYYYKQYSTFESFIQSNYGVSTTDELKDVFALDYKRKQAINELQGNNSNLIKELREKLIQMISNIEVNIDYPEYEDIEELTNSKILPKLKDYVSNLKTIISKSKEGRIIKEGINVALIGKPNVGKSSLLNTLLEEEKAIVTNIAGTTRDIVEGQINISGVVFNLIDTAGIRDTDNVIEQIGVEKSKKVIKDCNLILLIFNNNDILTDEDKEIFNYVKETNKPIIIIINKVDLETRLNKEYLSKDYKIVEISTKTKLGINDLKETIKETFNLEKIITDDINYSFNSRSIGLLEKSKDKIVAAINAINDNYPVDIVELEIKSAWEILGEIIGETYTEELLDNLFSRFCLGK